MMIKAYIGLGSNQQDPVNQLKLAMDHIASIPGVTVCRTSSFYRSKPVGPQDQPWFINAVSEIETELEAEQLLDELQAIENRQGRVRTQHWGPRTLDLDILLYGKLQLNTERLILPHKEMKHRNFVLAPLAEIAPELNIPGMGPVSDLLQCCHQADIEKLHEQKSS